MRRANTLRLTRRALSALKELDCVLDEAYSAPEGDLDNKQDPLDEAIYIILSFQTGLDRFKLVWEKLRETFPSWEDVSRAPLSKVARVVRIGGLHEQKARTIKKLLEAVKAIDGKCSLEWLRDMEDEEAERILTKLPGLSWKGARCVMLYSLQRNSLPVDGNTFRIFKRVGIIPQNAVYRRRALHDNLQRAVEPSRRKIFHINLVVHGQRTCLPRRPRCSECAALSFCVMRGVPDEIKSRVRSCAKSEGPVSRMGDRT